MTAQRRIREIRVQNRELLLMLKLIKGGIEMATKKTTPKDYDRWDGKTGIKVISKPKKKTVKKKGCK